MSGLFGCFKCSSKKKPETEKPPLTEPPTHVQKPNRVPPIEINEVQVEHQKSLTPNHGETSKGNETIFSDHSALEERKMQSRADEEEKYTTHVPHRTRSDYTRLDKANNEMAIQVGILSSNALSLFNQKRYDEALANYMGALEISLQIYEPNDVNLAILFADIGMVCYKQGKLDEGLENCDKAMMIFTEKCGIDSPEVGKTHNSMAIILAEQGKNDLALIHFNKALDITIKNNPKGHIDIAILYDNIGQINYDRSRYKEALDCFKKALEIKITLQNENTLELAILNDKIGSVNRKQRKYKEALDYHQKALDILLRQHPKENNALSIVYQNLAFIYEEQNNFKEALNHYEKSLDFTIKCYGKEHKETALTYNNIGLVLFHKGEFQKAIDYYKKGLGIFSRQLGENHFKTADCYQKIAQGLIKLKLYDEAPKLLDNALAIYSKIADKDYRVATIYLLKSEISLDKENYIESFDLCQKGLNIVKEKRDLSSSQLIPFNTQLGKIYMFQKKYDLALKEFQFALKLSEKTYGRDHPTTASLCEQLSRTFELKGDGPNCIKYLALANHIAQKISPPTLILSTILHRFGNLNRKQKEYQKAREYWKKSLEVRVLELGLINEESFSLLTELEELYKHLKISTDELKPISEALSGKHS